LTDVKPMTAFQQTDKEQQLLPCCRFPAVERMGQEVLSVQRLTHGYQDRTLFKNCDFEMEKSERVALIGKPPFFVPFPHSTPSPFCLPAGRCTCSHTCCKLTQVNMEHYRHMLRVKASGASKQAQTSSTATGLITAINRGQPCVHAACVASK